MAKKALVRDADGYIKNVIELKPKSTWTIPPGYSLLNIPGASPGDSWDGARLIRPIPTIDPDMAEYAAAKSADAKLDILARRAGLI